MWKEKHRRTELETQADSFQKAKLIRALIAELKARQANGISRICGEEALRWSTWAEALAKKYDPFENGYIERAAECQELDAELDCGR